MKVPHPRVWIAIFSAAAVLYLAVGYSGRTSPGPLSAVHGREPDLAGNNDCSACHGNWFKSMEEACLSCHEVIERHILESDGLHGALTKARARNCALCHSEHHGEGFSLVNRQSFLQAGSPDPEAFDHRMVGFDMDGKHLEISCGKCHEHADVDLLPKGAHRYVGLEQDCAKCHEDAHDGRMVLACADCHGQIAFKALDPRGHEAVLPLIGGHAEPDCVKCHVETGAHSLEAIGRGRAAEPRDCQACHESPHRAAFVSGVADLVSMRPGASCVVCHEAEHESFRQEGLEVSDAHHAQSGFPLGLPHDKLACRDCHQPEAEPFLDRYPGRDADHCRACHEDPHGGQFEEACLECHDRERFAPHGFNTERHARTRFALTDSHLEAECHDCHVPPGEGEPRRFRTTPTRCEQCHLDAHGVHFVIHAQELALDQRGTCANCHLSTTFRELPASGFDHGRWTRFTVRDAHAQADCSVCHEDFSPRDLFGRAFGFVEDQFGAYRDCATCHADPHDGAFDGEALPARVEDRVSCERCHVQTSFRALQGPFDHGLWTGFALEDAHARARCADCHTPLRKPQESGRTWERAVSSRCADCHKDPHAGQFLVEGATDCGRCHRPTTFQDSIFVHQTESRFALGKSHENVDCDACHPRVRVGDRQVIKYRPLRMRCSDCHDAPERSVRKEFKRR